VVRKGKMLKDERGQMSIDFIAGLSLFMLTLLFLVQFIPGMFVPFQTETIDLSSVSYRTSVILVEDPGWWDTGTDNGEDWETDNHLANVSRVGLAIDKEHPNMLNMRKIGVFDNDTQITDANLTRTLGLYRNIGGNEIDYGYNITIADSGNNILAARGDPTPEYGDVSSMKRLVKAQTGTQFRELDWGELCSEFPHQDDKADFNITKPEENVTIIIKDIMVQGVDPKLNHIKINGHMKTLGADYWVWIDNGTGYFEPQSATPIHLPPVPYNTTSRLKITINRDAFDAGINLIEINFVQVIIPKIGHINLDELEMVAIYENAILRVKIWT
jgi:hypothetical protein